MRSWVIGKQADCDVVVDSLLASGRHCQLTHDSDGFLLNDLGSTNGTYVDGVRINAPTRVVPGDAITLGKTVPMPWPPELVRFISVGRLPENDVVLDDPRVSGRHARIVVVEGVETQIQDLGSSNGTFLNSVEQRVTAPTGISASDTVYFGTLAVSAARLLPPARPTSMFPPPRPTAEPAPSRPIASYTEPVIALTETPTRAKSISGTHVASCVVVLAPVFAILIVLLFGRHVAAPITTTNWASVEQALASTCFALVLAAILLGGSFAVADVAAGTLPGPKSGDATASLVAFGSRLAVLASLCTVAATLLLAIAYWGSGFSGNWLAMWGVLVMVSLVGLLLGLVISALVSHWAATLAILLFAFVPMIALGARPWPLPEMNQAVRLGAAAMPSRWSFEALLLLESPRHAAPAIAEEPGESPRVDLVEKLFPAGSERMGPAADALALGSMLIGLSALAAFISIRSPPAQ